MLTYRHYLYVVAVCLLFFPTYSFANVLKNQKALDEFYLSREGEPLWLENSVLNKAGSDLLGVLNQAWQNGLNPETYHVNDISLIIDKNKNAPAPFELELLLTDGYINYIRDLSGMRVNARDIGLNPRHWKQRISAAGALSILPENKKDIAKFLLSRESQTKTYQRLKSELITLRALNNVPLDKIKQIIVNMERLRWVEDIKPERFVVVNIPSATLWAIDNGNVHFQMPVLVGRKERQTPPFITNISGVRFNPTWTVPRTIKEEDILPKLQENPAYLADKGMELYDGYGKDAPTLDPFAIDWKGISKSELHSLRMVQISGKHNPLGRIRILMANEHNIYLHDTNEKALFSLQDRAKSSGCIRLQDPEKLALFILEKRNDWNEKKMQEALNKGETGEVYTSEKLMAYLLYYTIWLGEKSQVIYGSDIYSRDKTLLQLLEKLDGFYIIGDNGVSMVQAVD